MKELWNEFLGGFCRVDFLCYYNEPNWLGYIVIGIFSFYALGFILILIGNALEIR